MKIVSLRQNSPEWHKWREQGIGASDAPNILKENPYQSMKAFEEVKSGRKEVFENERMARGKRLEPEARRLYQELSGNTMRPVCVVHDTMPWMRASLDGLSENSKIILEIKCPRSLKVHKLALDGMVPIYYKGQLQHQLAVVDTADFIHYFSYYPDLMGPDQVGLVKVYRDEEYIKNLIEKEREWYDNHQNKG